MSAIAQAYSNANASERGESRHARDDHGGGAQGQGDA
jgi:hypothetical protein